MTTLRIVLGDQLTFSLPSLEDLDAANDVILMGEFEQEATNVRHHQKKLAFMWSAMRHFAQSLAEQYHLFYWCFEDDDNPHNWHDAVAHAVDHYQPECIVVTQPNDYRVWQMVDDWQNQWSVPVEIREDTRFLCTPAEFAEWAEGRRSLRMEHFYRRMRQAYGILYNQGQPEGGQWNYDANNRQSPSSDLQPPSPYSVEPDAITEQVLEVVDKHFSHHFGKLRPFSFAVTREQALEALQFFIQYNLPYFGDYQDAMLTDQHWMYHSHLSFYLNIGLLTPLECIQQVEQVYYQGDAPLNAVEGFIRQILGWREFIRGIYWLKMPEYRQRNALNAQRPLPELFWTGDTQMNCLKQCVKTTQENAYAHHIQRLMVLGNFALLVGAHPDYVNEWYHLVYADAYEWVELPNVTGMILFADGGLFASKPYAAGGSYINKMSDYCKNCVYKVSHKTGPQACPFNYLYWDFLQRNQDVLQHNPRLGMAYKTWQRMSDDKKAAIKRDAERFLQELPFDQDLDNT